MESTLDVSGLSESNYSMWAVKMKIIMRSLGVWSVIEGTDRDDDKDQGAMVAISQAMPDDVMMAIAEKQSAKEAWEALREMRVGEDRVKKARVQVLKRQLNKLQMEDSEKVNEYSMKLTTLVAEIRSLVTKLDDSEYQRQLLVSEPLRKGLKVESCQRAVEINYFSLRLSGRLSVQKGRKIEISTALKKEAITEEVEDVDVDVVNMEVEEMAVALVLSGELEILTYPSEDEAFEAFKKVKIAAEIEKDSKLKASRTDRGGEFTSNEFKQYCEQMRIKRYLTAPYSPQQNGIVERSNQTVVSMARSLSKSMDVPDRSKKMVFIGYDRNTKGYRVFDLVTRRVVVSRDVVFEEEKKWEWNKVPVKETRAVGNTTSQKYFTVEGMFDTENRENEQSISDSGIDIGNSGSNSPRTPEVNGDEFFESVQPEMFEESSSVGPYRGKRDLKTHEGLEVHHMDVKSAFLNGELEEDVYVIQTPGFEIKEEEHKMLKLHKALYGLRQAPRAWNSKLDKSLKVLGFEKCSLEHAAYTRSQEKKNLIVGVYVDDLIITGESTQDIGKFKSQMKKLFSMSDLGLLSYYLGIEVCQTPYKITLNQSAYARKVLDKCGMKDCNSTHIPMEPRLKLNKESTHPPVDKTLYRSVVGSLRYLLHTRPDLAFSVGMVSRHMEKPMTEHMAVVKHISRYVKGTLNLGCAYEKNEGVLELVGYSDTDLAGDINDSDLAAACQGVWLGRLLADLLKIEVKKMVLKIDNQSAIALSRNPVYHERSKHIDTRFHYIRDCIESGMIEIQHVCTKDQSADILSADILTKSLAKPKFQEMRERIGVKTIGREQQA
ncbi:Unknown protein [Striga hermonthica]|uniref:Integrase catalytic domain-containing protein n=1 Tax=Striga hermonthica TaxID=68872 RepID=A0A9N7MYH1_STRHE|nr:Unknown protein [Striga hermonthica]